MIEFYSSEEKRALTGFEQDTLLALWAYEESRRMVIFLHRDFKMFTDRRINASEL